MSFTCRALLVCLLLLATLVPSTSRAATLTLETCLALAREHNPTLQAAASVPRQAQEQWRIARSVELPQINLISGYTMQHAPQQVVVAGMTEPTQERNYAHLSLSAEQLVYDFGRSAGRIAAADAEARAADFAYVGQQQDLFLQTVAAYYRVLTAEKLVQAANDELTQTGAHLKVAQALFAAGSVTRNDVLQAEVSLAASRQQQLARNGELNNAWLRLNYLLGRPASERAELKPDTPFDLALVPASSAIDQRPELIAQQQHLAAAQGTVRQYRAAFLPELYARVGADYVDNDYVKEQTIYAATIGLRVNLYDGAAKNAALAGARLKLKQQQLVLADLRQQARLEYSSALNDATVSAQRSAVAQAAIEQARENLRINENRYQAQVGTATDVLDAQTLLTTTRTDLFQAQFDYQIAVARVLRATGSL